MNKKIKKFLQISFLVIVLLAGTFNVARAADSTDSTTTSTDTTTCTSPKALVAGVCTDPVTPLSSDKSITAFTFPNEVVGNTVITEGTVKDDNGNITGGTIVVTMPSGIVLTNLVPTFTVNASIKPDFTVFDFTTPQTYTITAEDKTTQIYTVTVKVADPQSSGGGGSSTPPPLNAQVQVDVPTSCSATDTDGVIHNYGESGSSNSYFAICALETAIKNGLVSNVQLSNKYPSMGLFVAAIDGVTADSNSQYWAIYQNGSYASDGVVLLKVATGDSIMFQLHDFSDKNLGAQVTINIHSLISNAQNSGGGVVGGSIGGGGIAPVNITSTKPAFDTTKALDFLASQQKIDGSFGEDLYTDWSALTIASNSNYQDQKTKLVTYFSTDKLSGNLLTDYERRAIALMALNLNPYNMGGINYIEKIIASFDGKQFGDPNQDNDDIFALIVLQNSGYTQDDKIIGADIPFILNAQNENGSWDNSVDMTGAAMEALSLFNQNEQVKNALTKAENFLKQNQKDDGSWNENASSTAWAIEGILAQGEKIEDWAPARPNDSSGAGGKGVNTPLDYLATVQDTDGGIKDGSIQNKIWETAYVVSALSGKTWNQTMQKFDKQDLPKVAIIKNNSIASQTSTKKNSVAVEVPKKTESNTANQNTASAINTATPPPAATQTETPKKNWFIRLLDIIFGSN